jgi:glucose-1-phosphate cytidylyltransferase
MIVVLLAGGYGTRISEETDTRPKPMVEIGGKPILWHIMKIFSQYGYNEFIICLGYKGYFIKEYFANYFLHQSDLTIDLKDNSRQVHNNASENWKITLVDTGLNTMTGGRIKRIHNYIGNEPFLLTYGDGLFVAVSISGTGNRVMTSGVVGLAARTTAAATNQSS